MTSIGSASGRSLWPHHPYGHTSAVGVAHWLRPQILGVGLEVLQSKDPKKNKEESLWGIFKVMVTMVWLY